MRLVSFAESIKSRVTDLLDARSNLFMCESMTCTQQVFIFTSTIDECRFPVEEETMILRVVCWPRHTPNAKWCFQFIRGLPVAFNHRGKIV